MTSAAMPATVESMGDEMIWDSATIDAAVKRMRIYPCRVESLSNIPSEVLKLFAGWKALAKYDFVATSMPWVPVGNVGPVLIIGHSDPEKIRPFLPTWLVQIVMLTPMQHHALIRATIFGLRSISETDYVIPEKKLNLNGLRPSVGSPREVMDFLVGLVYVNRPIYEMVIAAQQKTTPATSVMPPDLPEGFAEAVQYFTGKAMVADVRVCTPDADIQQALPDQIRSNNNAFGLFSTEKFFFMAVSKVPNGAFEDLVMAMTKGPKRAGVNLILAPNTVIRDTIARASIRQERVEVAAPRTGTTRFVDRTKLNINIDEGKMRAINPKVTTLTNEERFHWALWIAHRMGASDIHFEQIDGRGRIRARIDGDLRVIDEVSDENMRGIIGVVKGGAFSGFSQSTHDTQDTRATIRVGEAVVNIRANLIPHRKDGYQVMVLRLLTKNKSLANIDKLGTTPRNARILRAASTAPKGLILVTGPTGSGKTTTLYACLAEINKPDIKINTLEDPVEVELEGATQSMVDAARDVTFDRLMEAVLRQDPDVILVGEIRSTETAKLALSAAETGHLVFATMHTNDEVGAITRLVELLKDRALLPVVADNVLLLQAQRLVKRLCPSCSSVINVSPEQDQIFTKHKMPKVVHVREANREGCPKCHHGYSGRLAIMALLPVTTDIAKTIAEGANSFSLREKASEHGFRSLYHEALIKVSEGLIDFREAEVWKNTWEEFDFKD